MSCHPRRLAQPWQVNSRFLIDPGAAAVVVDVDFDGVVVVDLDGDSNVDGDDHL